MPKPTSAANPTPIRFLIVTMDSHLASATRRAAERLKKDFPGLSLIIHAADEWASDEAALQRCRTDIAQADIIVATMLFMEDHFLPVMDALQSRRDQCDAMVCAMSAGEIVRLTRMGRFSMDGKQSGAMALLKRLRGAKKATRTAGAEQMRMLRRLPKLLRFVPGTAQDVRAYFLTLQYWLAGSEENIANMVRFLLRRYAGGARAGLLSSSTVPEPLAYPEVGIYHPALKHRLTERVDELPHAGREGVVGLLLLRSYLLAGNSAHYDGVIKALEARGLNVIPVFASGLDSRPAIERFLMRNGTSRIDALVSLTGFSMVGGPAYNDSKAAEDMMAALDVPYVSAHPVEFQTLEQWQSSERGLLPVEATIMVAIPELDGATPDGVRRPVICRRLLQGHGSAPGTRRHACRARRQARRAAPERAGAAARRHRAVQFSAERGHGRNRRLPVSVRVPAWHAGGAQEPGLHHPAAGDRG